MAVNIHSRAAERNFEITEKLKPINVDLAAVSVGEKNKGILKLSLSVTYFFVLVYFLVQLLA